MANLGKSTISGSPDKIKTAASQTGTASAGLGKSVAGGATDVGVASAQTGTDAGITAAVNSRLKAEMPTDAIKVNALTNTGVVTLTGTVPTTAARSKAEQIARSTSGVKQVVNQLEVK
jgi:osmotically-inducible protein OsmY